MESENPYASPSVTDLPPSYSPQAFNTATRGLRFVNFLIDTVAVVVISGVAGFVLGLTVGGSMDPETLGLVGNLIGIVFQILYFALTEGLTGRTLGKLITGTKVVDAQGNTPTVGKAFLRTLCRFIPFEPLSFFGKDARGWHDTITKTWVIKSR